jgi:hypothetical protein
MHLLERFKSQSYLFKLAQWAVVTVVAYSFIGFLIAPIVMKMVMSTKLSETLNRHVTIEDIDLNPYTLSINITGFTVRDQDDEKIFASVGEFYSNLQIASLFKGGIILKELRIEQPYVNIDRYEETSYNFSDLIEDNKGDKSKPAVESDPLKFSLNNIQILDGSIDFLDSYKDIRHTVRGITVKIPIISNLPHFIDIYVQPYFQATINETPFILKGRTKPFSDSLETSIDLDIKDINIPDYLVYLPVPTNFKILSGTIDVENKILFRQYSDKPASIIFEGDLSLKNLTVVDKEDKPLITLPVYRLKKAAIDLSKKEMTLEEAYSEDGEIFVRRSKDGTVNLQPQLPKLAKKIEKAAEEKEGKPWIVRIKKLAYEDFTINFEDRVPTYGVNLNAKNIKLRAENISTEKDRRGSLSYSFILNETGTVSAESSLSINPVSSDVKLSLKDINIIPLQPYITDKIKILITDGSFSTEGNLSHSTSEKGELSAEFKGSASLSKFASVDKTHGEDFLKWDSLYLKGIDFKSIPFSFIIDEVALTDFYSKLVINPDGTLNVQGIVKEEGTESVPTEEIKKDDIEPDQEDASLINIKAFTLQGGTINFSDMHIKPNFSANLLEIGGRVSGLSSTEGSLADVDLRGKLENYAPLEIKGTINPLSEDLFVDLQVDFNDMDLRPLIPYSHKYVGYTIQKGKLSLDLKYLIENKKLDSSNSIFLDQFTLGDKVESPEATTLPVKFAIALLKNSKGEISLDLPVKGSIDDPEFNVGSVIVKLIVNLLVKAASSPFKLLGALVGGGEELSYIGFDFGTSGLSDPEKAKLDKLAQALTDRPSLNTEVAGYVDMEKDRDALIQHAFDSKLKAQKLKDLVKKGEKALSLDEITIDNDEYEKYLSRAYKEEEFPKPRNFLGIAKKLPVPEMEKLILTYIQVSDDDLRLLASQRALNVRDYFIEKGQIDSKRIFLTEAASLEPEHKDDLLKSRVDFKLR